MPAGVRFVDVLDDALRTIAWESPESDDSPRVRTAPSRPVVYSPLYALHTLTLDTVGGRVAAGREAGASHPPASMGPCWESGHTTSGRSGQRVDAKLLGDVSSRTQPPFDDVSRAAPDSARPARRLTSAQRISLNAFHQLGAAIRPDFSASELRSAFRLLARHYHPDRHPRASEGERQRLSHQFTTIRTSYETLLTALDSAIA